MDAETAQYITRSYRAVMGALRRGAVSPGRALYWAEEIAAGRAHPAQIEQLTAPPGHGVFAASADLAQQIMDALQRLASLVQQYAGQDQMPPEFRKLFPPGPGGQQAPRTLPPAASAPENFATAYGPGGLDPVTPDGRIEPWAAGLTDEEAARVAWDDDDDYGGLWPAAASAADQDWYTDEDLYRLLFSPQDDPGNG